MSDASNTEQLAETVFQAVKVYVQRHTATAVEAATKPLLERIAAAEKTLTESPKPLTAEEVAAEVERQVNAIEIVVPPAEPGPKGEPGERGADGKDAVIDSDLIAAEVEKQIKAIEIVVPDPIPGERGAPGDNGKDGKDAVIDYEKLKSWFDVARGEAESFISKAIPEQIKSAIDAIPKPKDGTDGRDGRDGERGPSGRDAAEIVVLPSIDAEKRYALGTWVRHRGGLWKSLRDTDEMRDGSAVDAGWACIVEGVANLSASASTEDDRAITLTAELSSGRKSAHDFVGTWPIDRGVWKPDVDYRKSDGISYNGCWWIAQGETKDRPGTSSAWRLAVKAGRDGKDMRPDGTIQRVPVRLGE